MEQCEILLVSSALSRLLSKWLTWGSTSPAMEKVDIVYDPAELPPHRYPTPTIPDDSRYPGTIV